MGSEFNLWSLFSHGAAGDISEAVGTTRKYRRLAWWYDFLFLPTLAHRALAVHRLSLHPGDVVIDAGCGTGLNFSLIEAKIEPRGRLVGIDLTSEMLRRAQRRVERRGWANVTLIQSSVERAAIPYEADAALFSLVHDIMQSSNALQNVVHHLRPGARVAAFGPKWAPWWLAPINVLIFLGMFPFTSDLKGLRQPWRNLQTLVPDLHVRHGLAVYAAWGTVGPPGEQDSRL